MLTIKEIIKLDGVVETYNYNGNTQPDKVLYCSPDNRELDKNSVFVAIVGARFNPLKDLKPVISSGCRYIIFETGRNFDPLKESDHLAFIEVDSIINFIQVLGKEIAKKFQQLGGNIIAISGSNGKTTTKEMLFHLLKEKDANVICTQKNNNNHLGVPFTLFLIREKTQFAIIELGSNHPGEIQFLCELLNPKFGVTTNIGDTHLEFFGSRDTVYKEEGYLQFCCSEKFFVNMDDEFLSKINLGPAMLSFGEKNSDYIFSYNNTKKEIQVNKTIIKNEFITGRHNFYNLGVAFAVASSICPDFSGRFVEVAQSFRPTANRSEWKTYKNSQVFLDAYNANPSSMRAAILGFFDEISARGANSTDACVILGDMNELGEGAERHHKELGLFVEKFSPAQSVYIGKFKKSYMTSEKNFLFDEVSDLEGSIVSKIFSYKYIFIKGSRSLQLESILDIS